MNEASARIQYEFGEFRLDAGQRRLYAAHSEPISLTARVFVTLLHLVSTTASWRISAR